ncbi:MAG: restriction endonuclease subunit S [Acidimicrobiales bacterium]
MTTPNGWRRTTLGDLGRYLNGRAFKKDEWRPSGRPIIRIQNLTGSSEVFNYFQGEVEDRYVVRPGDLLVSWAATLGAYFWQGPEAVLNQHIFKVESNIDPKFHKYLLDHKLEELIRHTHGSGMVHITRGKFDTLPVVIPPLDEQRRIVDLLEDHLSRLDAADAGLRTSLARSEAMLTSGLWHTTHGLDAAKTVELQSIAEVRLGRQRSPRNHSGDRMRPYLRAANVGWDELRLDDVKEMQFTEAEEQTYRLEPGDIILTEASGSPAEVGKSAVYRGAPSEVCFQNTLLRVRCHSADPEFVQKYLLAEARAGRFMPESRGVGINHLGRTRLAAVEVDVPTPTQQAIAVAACRELVDEIGRLQSSIKAQARRSEALRRSLLAAAFSGRLTGAAFDMPDGKVIEELAGA